MTESPLVPRVLRLARRLLALGLYYSGFLGLWIRVALRRKAVVLTYHRVLSREDAARTWSHPGIVVTRETFERHLDVLRRHFRLLSVEELADRLDRGTGFDGPSCLITFDDGWRDTCTEAWPVLQQYRTPAVVFLPVNFIGAQAMFWQEHLGALLHQAWTDARADGEQRRALSTVLDRSGIAALLDEPPASIRQAIQHRINRLKNATLEPPAALIAELEPLVGARATAASVDAFMSWDHVRDMAAAGIAFGGHGASHRILTTLPPDEVAREVQTSMRELRAHLGDVPVSFSYPNGNHHAQAEAAVRGAGYRVAFSTRAGHVAPGDAPLSLRRLNMHEDATRDAPLLLARVAGVF